MQNHNLLMPILVLTMICLVMTGLVSLTYETTREQRLIQEERAANENRLALFAQAASFDLQVPSQDNPWPEGITEWTRALDDQGKLLGTLLVSQKRGYGGQVPVMVALDLDGKLLDIRVLAHEETPGLGNKIEEASFTQQFAGKTTQPPFSLDEGSQESQPIDAISGATRSSRAVTDAVNEAVDFYVSRTKEGS